MHLRSGQFPHLNTIDRGLRAVIQIACAEEGDRVDFVDRSLVETPAKKSILDLRICPVFSVRRRVGGKLNTRAVRMSHG
jgi:hypothetical protein